MCVTVDQLVLLEVFGSDLVVVVLVVRVDRNKTFDRPSEVIQEPRL